MNIYLLEHPLFWFLVLIISNVVVVSNRVYRRKLIAEADKNSPYGALILPFDFTALIGWILIITSMIMTNRTITDKTPTSEMTTLIILAVISIFAVMFRDVIQKQLRWDIIAYWAVRATQYMSVVAIIEFFRTLPAHSTPWQSLTCWLYKSASCSANVFVLVIMLYLVYIVGVVTAPEKDAYKKHLKSLRIFNPITSIITIPGWAIYRVCRAIYNYRKSKP